MARSTNLTLVDMLLEQAENLTNQDLTPEQIEDEIKKAQALSSLAGRVVDVKNAETRDLEVKINAVKIASTAGFKYKPDDLQLEDLTENVKTYPKKGFTPEGLEYEE